MNNSRNVSKSNFENCNKNNTKIDIKKRVKKINNSTYRTLKERNLYFQKSIGSVDKKRCNSRNYYNSDIYDNKVNYNSEYINYNYNIFNNNGTENKSLSVKESNISSFFLNDFINNINEYKSNMNLKENSNLLNIKINSNKGNKNQIFNKKLLDKNNNNYMNILNKRMKKIKNNIIFTEYPYSNNLLLNSPNIKNSKESCNNKYNNLKKYNTSNNSSKRIIIRQLNNIPNTNTYNIIPKSEFNTTTLQKKINRINSNFSTRDSINKNKNLINILNINNTTRNISHKELSPLKSLHIINNNKYLNSEKVVKIRKPTNYNNRSNQIILNKNLINLRNNRGTPKIFKDVNSYKITFKKINKNQKESKPSSYHIQKTSNNLKRNIMMNTYNNILSDNNAIMNNNFTFNNIYEINTKSSNKNLYI